jgi:NADH dehydrogenase FAD-containing subunit
VQATERDQEDRPTGWRRERPRVVVAGMGDTGILVATHLSRSCAVVGIGTRPALVSGQELGNRLANPEHWRRNFLVPFERFRRLDGVRAVHGSITRVDTDDRQVHVATADGRRLIIPYDLLVVASGVSNGFWRQNHVEGLDAVDDGLAAVAEQIGRAGSVAVVGGGATGVSAAANLARRHPDKAIHLFHGQDEPLPGYHPRVRRDIVRQLTAAGVQLHPGHRARVPDGFVADRLTTEPIEWSTGQEPFTADLVLWAIGAVRPNTDFLPADLLDDDGFVRVDEHLRVPGHPDVLAIGDVAASDPNRCSARNWGYRVVAHNVKAIACGREDRLKRFQAPENRWGSVLGLQDDGMVVYQPNGASFRVPRWAVQPLLFDLFTNVIMYGGLRRSRSPR